MYSTAFMENLPDIAYVQDLDHKILYINNAGCIAFDTDPEEAVKKKCFELYEKDACCLNCPVEEVLHENKPVEKSFCRSSKNRWENYYAFPIKDAEGQCVFISRDIREEKFLETFSPEFSLKIKRFIDRMPIGLVIWDADFHVSVWNRTAEKIFGYPAKEALGRSAYDLVVPDDVSHDINEIFARLKEGDDSVHLVNENVTKGGERICCSWNNTPIMNENGDVTAILSMVQDITHEKQLQREVVRSAQLASIGKLAANVAHEINNPITGVINYSQILLNQNQLNETQGSMVKRIHGEGERIASIVHNLLNFSRKPTKQFATTKIQYLVNESLELLTLELKKSYIDIEFDFAENLPLIKCNSQQITQVLINIVQNAVHALADVDEANKVIRFSTRHIEQNGLSFVQLIVANNGPHIPQDILDKIFEPFLTTKRVGLGTGLGLSISLEIMKDHDGLLEVRSNPGELVEMVLSFPCAKR